jgi:cephalosporin hydroxylase
VIRVGSSLWRLRHYGFWALAKYLLGKFKAQNFDELNIFFEDNCIDLEDFLKDFQFELDSYNLLKTISDSIAEIVDWETRNQLSVKSIQNNGNFNGNQSRFFILSLLASRFKPSLIIETGTQHGYSSYVLAKCLEKSHFVTKIHTFDVTGSLPKITLPGITYHFLDKRVRRQFKKKVTSLILDINGMQSSLFFHDSDHSYENMMFEMEYAWDSLKVDILVIDDSDLNSAVLDFCRNRNLLPLMVRMNESEPLLAIISRRALR